MREIIFRGKRLDNGEWLYGSLVIFNVHYLIFNDEWRGEVNPDTVGQYTGLKDKNGKEIYEGDIIRSVEYENKGITLFHENDLELFTLDDLKGKIGSAYLEVITFDEGAFSTNNYWFSAFFGDMRKSSPIYELEIMGNIHDNPELLERR